MVLDAQHLGEAQVVVSAGGTLIVATVNPCNGLLLVDALERGRAPCGGSADLSRVCDRLETEGWAVEDATAVTVPLTLMPFNPGRIPKTVLAYLYARHPEIETYCFLVRARRAWDRPLRPRPVARAPSGDFSTMAWMLRIKPSLTWRAVVKYCTLRARILPPQSGGGRLYERVRSTIRRRAVGGG